MDSPDTFPVRYSFGWAIAMQLASFALLGYTVLTGLLAGPPNMTAAAFTVGLFGGTAAGWLANLLTRRNNGLPVGRPLVATFINAALAVALGVTFSSLGWT